MTTPGTLYLIPSPISEDLSFVSDYYLSVFKSLNHFYVEKTRTARRFIKKVLPEKDINSTSFYEIDRDDFILSELEDLLKKGVNVGVLSEAGCPGIADPGNKLVQIAHKIHCKIIPLVGPSSVLLAMMSSGLNGQNFSFVGYLPIKEPARRIRILELERLAKKNQAQIFIETPYRNESLFNSLLKGLSKSTLLCVAAGIGSPDSNIRTKTIFEWTKSGPVKIQKIPSIFIIG